MSAGDLPRAGQHKADKAAPQIRACMASDADAVYQLLCSNGWGHRIPDVGFLQALVAASQRALVASVDGRVVGFARALTDGLSNGYLSMVAVDSAYRGQGIGRALVEAIIGNDPQLTWVLRAGRSGAAPFFAKLGFVASTEAMERPRRRAAP